MVHCTRVYIRGAGLPTVGLHRVFSGQAGRQQVLHSVYAPEFPLHIMGAFCAILCAKRNQEKDGTYCGRCGECHRKAG